MLTLRDYQLTLGELTHIISEDWSVEKDWEDSAEAEVEWVNFKYDEEEVIERLAEFIGESGFDVDANVFYEENIGVAKEIATEEVLREYHEYLEDIAYRNAEMEREMRGAFRGEA